MRSVTQKYSSTHALPQISTHTLHAERDYILCEVSAFVYEFQLTRSMRSVTKFYAILHGLCRISTHTLHAERDVPSSLQPRFAIISTHTLHAERDSALIMAIP